MTIATRLKDFIDRKGISYDTVAHHRTSTSRQSAIAAHIPGSIVAKSVVVHHELGYALAVVPSTHRIELGTLQDVMVILRLAETPSFNCSHSVQRGSPSARQAMVNTGL